MGRGGPVHAHEPARGTSFDRLRMRWTTAAWCPASCTCCARAGAGATCRRRTVRPPRSPTGSTGGPGAASGVPCWQPLPKRAGSPGRLPSTAPIRRRTAVPMAARGGEKPSGRPFAGRADHQDPHPVRHPRPPCRRPPDPRQCQRREDRPCGVGGRPRPNPASHGRQGLRRRLAQGRSAQGRRTGIDPVLWLLLTLRGSCGQDQAAFEQVEARSPVALALDEFQPIDLAFCLSAAPGLGQGGPDRGGVAV